MFDAPDDDGVAGLLAPEFGNPGQTEEALGFAQVAVQTDGEHDGMVAAGAALAGEDVIDDVGFRPDSRARVERFMPRSRSKRPQVVTAGIISGIFRIKIGF